MLCMLTICDVIQLASCVENYKLCTKELITQLTIYIMLTILKLRILRVQLATFGSLRYERKSLSLFRTHTHAHTHTHSYMQEIALLERVSYVASYILKIENSTIYMQLASHYTWLRIQLFHYISPYHAITESLQLPNMLDSGQLRLAGHLDDYVNRLLHSMCMYWYSYYFHTQIQLASQLPVVYIT